jgi:hypothetical protein
MLRRIAEVGSAFDWISPVLSVVQDVANGPSHTFLIPDDSGWSGHEIARHLRDHGVKCWGLMIVSGTLMVSVRAAQAGWAQYLLDRAGIPIEGGRVAAAHRSVSSGPGSRGRSRQAQGVGDTLRDWLDLLLE